MSDKLRLADKTEYDLCDQPSLSNLRMNLTLAQTGVVMKKLTKENLSSFQIVTNGNVTGEYTLYELDKVKVPDENGIASFSLITTKEKELEKEKAMQEEFKSAKAKIAALEAELAEYKQKAEEQTEEAEDESVEETTEKTEKQTEEAEDESVEETTEKTEKQTEEAEDESVEETTEKTEKTDEK